MSTKLTLRAHTGTELQRLAAMAILVSVDPEKASEVAERLDNDSALSDELRQDAFQVRLLLQTNAKSKSEFAIAMLKWKDPMRSRLAIRALVSNDTYSFRVLRQRLYIDLPSLFRYASDQQNTLLPPGIDIAAIKSLLTDENEGIAAYAGYFAVLLGDAAGMEPLLKYWQKIKGKGINREDSEETITILVYRAIGVLDDPQYIPVLQEIYGKMQEYEVRDFYWSIRTMTGPEILSLRKEIRDTHGMANLQ